MTTDTNFTNTELGTDITTEDVRDGFELLDDWEERYGYIMDLGKKLPAFPDDERREKNYVHGCQSQVWLIHWKDPESGRLYLLIDSDAMIVRGLAAIIMIALNGRTPDDLLAVDIEGLFEELDLMRHISPTRGNGLRAMVEQIRATAQQYT
ncbi:SufE family protein [Halospina sp. K52047b]|uniref:SufE family protein n=1 Tax=Halospina sp. K52047b TaxID=2614160 RepID=UPI00124A6153|nr:SufE family protein [Halospina sp. K52047b]KAA8978289.1 SufE family protein [Halospina sp. K52047b]